MSFHDSAWIYFRSMLILRRIWVMLGAYGLASALVAQSVTHPAPTLKNLYDHAQSLQVSGDLEQASFAYKQFLSTALSQLAYDRAYLGDKMKAANHLEAALELRPGDLQLTMRTAGAERDSGNLARAHKLAEDATKEAPKDADVHGLLGGILEREGRLDEATRELKQALALHPTLENGFALAAAYLTKKDDKDAANLFAQLQGATGNTAAIHMDIGRAYGVAGFPEQAIAEFKKGIAIDPSLPGIHYSLGASYLLSMGEIDFPQASAEFRKELVLHPNDFLSHSQLGYIALSQHKYVEAESELKRATELNPRDPDTFVSLGQLYVDTNHLPDAESALRKAIALTVDPSRNHYQVQRAHYLLGRVLQQMGKIEEAKGEMQSSAELLKLSTLTNQGKTTDQVTGLSDHPSETLDPQALREVEEREKNLSAPIADSYNNLGAISARDQDYKSAVAAFEEAAKWNQSLEGLDINLARAAYAAKDYTAAAPPLLRLLKLDAKDVWCRSALGVSLFMTGDYHGSAEALRPMEASLSTMPSLASIYAADLIESGDVSHGIERLRSLEAADPDKAEVHRMLGKAYLVSGEKLRGEEELRAALKLDPSDSESRRRLATLNEAQKLQK